ncbi:MAG: glycosyltransferase [Acidobacteria bacterium]|nr:glycosyltransferase [Acidobacteriota bacterium]
MTKPPRVSVLMTVHNGAPYIREAIDSIVKQTFEDWELIIVENGSTDDSPAIVASYTDPRIRTTWLTKDAGRTAALRLAFDLVRGTYIAVLDADDRSHAARLARQVALLDEQPDVVLVGTWAHHIDEVGHFVDRWTVPTEPKALYEWFGWGNPIVHSSAMYRAAVASAVGGYPMECPYAQDLALWLRILRHGRVAVIGEYLCDRRVSSASLTGKSQFRVDVARDTLALLRYAREHLTLGRESLRRNRERTAITSVKYGFALWQERQLLGACLAIGHGLFADPMALLRQSGLSRH